MSRLLFDAFDVAPPVVGVGVVTLLPTRVLVTSLECGALLASPSARVHVAALTGDATVQSLIARVEVRP